MARTVKPNGEAIKNLRTSLGLRVEDLAKKSKSSIKTVMSVEDGKDAFPVTLKRIADALDIEVNELLLETPAKIKSWEVTLRISIPYEEYDETKDLVELITLLREVLRRGGEMEPRPPQPGSTILTIDAGDNVAEVIRTFTYNFLDRFGVVAITATLVVGDWSISITDGDKKQWTEALDLRLEKEMDEKEKIRAQMPEKKNTPRVESND